MKRLLFISQRLWLLRYLWYIKVPVTNKAFDDKYYFLSANSQVLTLTQQLVGKVHNPLSSKTKYKSKKQLSILLQVYACM